MYSMTPLSKDSIATLYGTIGTVSDAVPRMYSGTEYILGTASSLYHARAVTLTVSTVPVTVLVVCPL